jgi:hypothetical protein
VLILIPLSLLGWIPISMAMFLLLPPRRAVVASIIGAWLLLPPAAIPLSGIPDFDKMMAATVGILIGTFIFQPNRLLEFRFRWFDLPMVCWCVAPLISSVQNGLGVYDGLSGSVLCIFRWALPYLIGRLYLSDSDGLRELTVGIVLGGLAYIPAILLELRLSPFLKGMVYGIYQWEGSRYGGYRPFVFLATGLELGMWMTAVCLSAVWLWKCGTLKRIGSIPFGSVLLPALLVVTVLCRSGGALVLLLVGLFFLFASTHFRSKPLFLALLLVPPLYYGIRITNLWTGDDLVQAIERIDPVRAQSLGFRFSCENVLIEKAMQQPVWGWGGWGRSRVVDATGKDWAATDGIWIIHLGWYGCFGLFSWTASLLLAPLLFLCRYPIERWKSPSVGPMAIVATLLGLYAIDCLLNGFLNVAYLVATGGLMGAFPAKSRPKNPLPAGAVKAPRPRFELPASDARCVESLPPPEPAHDSPTGETVLLAPQTKLASRYQELARTLKSQGSSGEAEAAWMHALELLTGIAASHPTNLQVQKDRWDCANNLAWFLINEAEAEVRHPQLAVRLASETTQANPDVAVYWNTLGAALYRADRATEAIAALSTSVELSSGGTIYDHLLLTLAHARLGQLEEARHWRSLAKGWLEQNKNGQPELARLLAEAQACVLSDDGSLAESSLL